MRTFLVFLFAVLALTSIAGCSAGHSDPSVVFDIDSVDRLVENGTAYDRCTVTVSAGSALILPESAIVTRSSIGTPVELYLKKTLAFGGHPGTPESIVTTRKNMGCAMKLDVGEVLIATYGEWDSKKEGGATIKLVAAVPPGTIVVKRKDLSLSTPLPEGWIALDSIPDPNHRAK